MTGHRLKPPRPTSRRHRVTEEAILPIRHKIWPRRVRHRLPRLHLLLLLPRAETPRTGLAVKTQLLIISSLKLLLRPMAGWIHVPLLCHPYHHPQRPKNRAIPYRRRCSQSRTMSALMPGNSYQQGGIRGSSSRRIRSNPVVGKRVE